MTHARISRIGKYEVESVVGEGAMGVVYRAVDSMLNRRVAIKVMNDAIAQNHDLRERFLREAQAAGSLQHPNVVTIYDFGEIDGHLYIAMEYVDGEDLEDLLHASIPISIDAKLELVIGVLQGLAFAHKRGVVHRDIKPANIRVDAEGKARIMDFGVAHLASSDMTRTGTMLGTPSYMAPEQILGAPVSPETDIFSVGAVLYELLTNTRPFKGETLQTLMYQILSTMPRAVTDIAPDVPPGLDRIVMRALAKDPHERYASALEMAHDLTMVKSSATALDGTGTALSLRRTIDTALADRHAGVRRTARRKETVRTVTAAVGVALIVVLGFQVWQSKQATGTADTSKPFVSSSAAGALTDPAPPAARADSSSAAAPASGTPLSGDSATRVTAPAASKAASTATGPTAQEIALARRVQTSALVERRRASEAGATAEQLRAGDNHNASGETQLRRGRPMQAATAFNSAAASWTTAERSAREAAAARAAAAASASQLVPIPTTPPAPRPDQQRIAIPPAAPATAAPPRAVANPSAEIGRVIAAYARAIESRDIAELRRAYPGMTADQRRAFEGFFRETRSLNATLAVSDLQVDGASADVRLSGTYQYVTTGGDTETRPVAFRATLQLSDGVWKLMAVR